MVELSGPIRVASPFSKWLSAAGDALTESTESEPLPMSDLDPAVPAASEGSTLTEAPEADGSTTDEYQFRQITDNDLGGMSLEDAISGTIVEFDDGDILSLIHI